MTLPNDVLRCEHAPFVFANADGRLRNFNVATLWDSWTEATNCEREGTMGWDEKIAVTNDLPILEYLLSTGEKIPAFPAAGDRPACFLDPTTVRVGVERWRAGGRAVYC